MPTKIYNFTGEKIHWSALIIVVNMVLHYGLYWCMAVFGNPEDEVSIGLHERTGDCDEKTNVYTAIGGVSLNIALRFLLAIPSDL